MNELFEYAQSIISFLEQNGATLNVESQRALGELLQNVLQLIQEPQPQGAPPAPTPPLQNAPHASAQVNAFKYDPKSQDLFIKYQDKYPGQNGPVYKYSGIPKFIYDVFSRGAVPPKTSGRNDWHEWKEGITPSLGAAVNALIKAGGFQYQRIS